MLNNDIDHNEEMLHYRFLLFLYLLELSHSNKITNIILVCTLVKVEVQVRFFTFLAFICWQVITPVYAVSDNTYSFFWSSNTIHNVGNVTYDGGALSSIVVNVSDIIPGVLSVTKHQCKSMWGSVWTHRAAYDYWIFVPKSVTANNGENIIVHIHQLPKDFSIVEEDSNQYILYKKIPEADNRQYKTCYKIGNTYNFTGSWNSSFILRLETKSLNIGQYTGNIPVKIAFAEYFKATSGSTGANSNPIQRWSLADARQNLGTVNIPFDINIRNICTVSPNDINLDHGAHVITMADGHTTSQDIYVRCVKEGDIDIKLSIKAINSPSTSYAEGVGVGLGNGWDSILKIDNSNITPITSNITMPANSKFNIKSVLKKTNNSQPGSLNGAAVMEVFFQ